MKAIADPDTIAALIEQRGGDGPPKRMKLPIGKEMNPAGLVSALVELHNYLNARGPTDEWDDTRRWLFGYVAMYKSQLAMEHDAPEIAFRTSFIKARKPFTKNERAHVAQALVLKKEIAGQVRSLKANRVWW